MVTLAWNWARRLSLLLRISEGVNSKQATEPASKDGKHTRRVQLQGAELGRAIAEAHPSDKDIMRVLASAITEDQIAEDYSTLVVTTGWMFPREYLRRCYVYELAESVGTDDDILPKETKDMIFSLIESEQCNVTHKA